MIEWFLIILNMVLLCNLIYSVYKRQDLNDDEFSRVLIVIQIILIAISITILIAC